MQILVTGNLGYIGSVLTEKLQKLNYDVTGWDIGYFESCLISQYLNLKKQIRKDLRKVDETDIKNFDVIIHLAGLSNDPLGEFMPELTDQINYSATMKLALLAKKNGVKRFIFASSQSMYGISNTELELDEDNSKKEPITAYAKTKWKAEQELMRLADDNFCVVALRPSTVFGPSPRFRSDIVYNNLIGCAFTTKKIEIWSDGSPWRPVIHVDDVCSAFISCLIAPSKDINKEAFNVGAPGGNYTVRDLALAAKECSPESELVFLNKLGKDERTYKINFDKISTVLKEFKPKWDLIHGGNQLIDFFKKINFSEEDFRGKKTIRLKQLSYLKDKNICNNNLEL
tara:strand:+ start:12 stop:1037 length:1026 start_codon:yes stop_codon:yes gene_type:complete